jgi:hypothetical protein
MFEKIKATVEYVKARLDERSTWIAIGGSIPVAAVLPAPWSFVSIAVGIVAAMIPDGSVSGK